MKQRSTKSIMWVKAGAGTFIKGTVNAQLIGQFILTVDQGVNWINISKRMDETAQAIYHTVMSNCFYLGKKVDEVYDEIYDHVKDNFDAFLDFITDFNGFADKGLGGLKIIVDQLDEVLPGYSSFKQYNLAFLILKDTYGILIK